MKKVTIFSWVGEQLQAIDHFFYDLEAALGFGKKHTHDDNHVKVHDDDGTCVFTHKGHRHHHKHHDHDHDHDDNYT
jgi:hypothetical protein